MTVVITPVDPTGPPVRGDRFANETLSGGAGGWESYARARRAPGTQWVGLPEQTYTLPFLLDGIGPKRTVSVEAEIRAIEALGLPVKSTGRPPVVQIEGPVLVRPSWRWVLQDIAYGELQRNDRGARVMQELTLTFLRHVDVQLVESPARRVREKKRS